MGGALTRHFELRDEELVSSETVGLQPTENRLSKPLWKIWRRCAAACIGGRAIIPIPRA